MSCVILGALLGDLWVYTDIVEGHFWGKNTSDLTSLFAMTNQDRTDPTKVV
jgi:hypothetical protein